MSGGHLYVVGKNSAHGQPKTDSGMRTVLLPDVAVDAIKAALRWKKEQRLRDHLPRLTRLGLSRFRLHDSGTSTRRS